MWLDWRSGQQRKRLLLRAIQDSATTAFTVPTCPHSPAYKRAIRDSGTRDSRGSFTPQTVGSKV